MKILGDHNGFGRRRVGNQVILLEDEPDGLGAESHQLRAGEF